MQAGAPYYQSMRTSIRLIAADDHPLILAGLDSVLSLEADMTLVATAADGEAALELYRKEVPDIVLMDLSMPVMDGVTSIRAIVSEFPNARIIALTTFEGDEDIYRAFSAGAKGFVVKDMLRTQLLTAIRQVHAGSRAIPPEISSRLAEFTPRRQLTPREIEVLELVGKGLSNRDIAGVLGREESTIKVHVKNILSKLDVDDRTAAVVVAIKRGFLRIE